MRSDYSLYTIAIIFFVLVGLLFMGYTGYLQLTTGNEATDLVIIMFSSVLGVVFVGLGYVIRPKKEMPQPPKPATEKPKKEPKKKAVKKRRTRKKT